MLGIEQVKQEPTALIKAKKRHVDPALASLFELSAGPIVASQPRSIRNGAVLQQSLKLGKTRGRKQQEPLVTVKPDDLSSDQEQSPQEVHVAKKRKRADAEDDLEHRHLKRLADEGDSDEDAPTHNPSDNDEPNQHGKITASSVNTATKEVDSDGSDDSEESAIPQHESLARGDENQEVEKASRTVFLGNVSTKAMTSKSARKTLLRHLASFFKSLSKDTTVHRVESLRFRSTAYAVKQPRKIAYIRQELMEATTPSTNAYAVYSTKQAAREAVKQLNATMVLDRHLRVDQVAHPAKIDHRRCVFVGNLAFVDDESQRQEDGDNKNYAVVPSKKSRPPADVEEGLWQQFSKVGEVESVRVIRDAQTRVGKGFAYVQFADGNGVEAALLLNEKKFPPLLPRKLRVTRARSMKRNSAREQRNKKHSSNEGVDRSLQGRAANLLGKAGAAQMHHPGRWSTARPASTSQQRPKDSIVFEGHRAQRKDGNKGLKLNSRQQKSKLRAAVWKRSKR